MSERVAYAMLALLALIVIAGLIYARQSGDTAGFMDLLNSISIGLVGAIGGWSGRAAMRDDSPMPVTVENQASSPVPVEQAP